MTTVYLSLKEYRSSCAGAEVGRWAIAPGTPDRCYHCTSAYLPADDFPEMEIPRHLSAEGYFTHGQINYGLCQNCLDHVRAEHEPVTVVLYNVNPA